VAPFNQFGHADFAALPAPPPGADGVLVAAEVTAFEQARLSCVGYVSETGHFALVSTAEARRGVVRVAGLDLHLPLELRGRARLEGRLSPGEVRCALTVSGWAEWEPLPGVVVVRAGSARRPVEVMLATNGRFRIAGTGEAELFGGAARVRGSVEASEAHVGVSGDLVLAVPRVGPGRPWVEMRPRGSMTIGPGPRFRFQGQGALLVLGREVATAHVDATEREIAVAARVETSRLRIGGIAAEVRASVAGRGALSARGLPRFSLEGDGEITAGGATVRGRVALSAAPRRATLSAAGEMRWLGQTWLSAAGRVSTDGAIHLAGRTSLALSLLPSQLPGGVELARLYLRLDVRAEVSLDPARALGAYDFGLDWSVGVQLPGGGAQTFVLAMQKRRLRGRATLDAVLLDVRGLTFVPAGNVQIPVPVLTLGQYRKVHSVFVKLPVLDLIRFLATTDMLGTIKSVVDPKLIGSSELFSIPTAFTPGVKNMTLDELSRDLRFSLALVWRKGGLGLAIRRGSRQKVIRFDDIV
jgi:hypothetical protein